MARFSYREIIDATTPASNWSKFVAHPFADRVLWLLANFAPRVRPNHLTLAAAVLGVGAGFGFVRGDRVGLAAGATLFYVAFALDAIDGALARLSSRTSASGAWMDTLLDFVRSQFCAACLTIGVARAHPSNAERAVFVGFGLCGLIAFYYYFAEVSHRIAGARPASMAKASAHPLVAALRRAGIVPSPFGLPDLEGVCFVLGPLLNRPFTGMAVALALGAVSRAAAVMFVYRHLHADTAR